MVISSCPSPWPLDSIPGRYDQWTPSVWYSGERERIGTRWLAMTRWVLCGTVQLPTFIISRVTPEGQQVGRRINLPLESQGRKIQLECFPVSYHHPHLHPQRSKCYPEVELQRSSSVDRDPWNRNDPCNQPTNLGPLDPSMGFSPQISRSLNYRHSVVSQNP